MTRARTYVWLVLAIVESTLRLADAAPGLDASFGVGGKVLTPVRALSRAQALVVQPDGKLVALGYRVHPAGFTDNVLVRYGADGSLDATFGSGGMVTVPILAADLALQADGKVVVSGTAADQDGIAQFALARFDSDGTLDAAFGPGGTVTTSIGAWNANATSLVVQPDGKLVAGGATIDQSSFDRHVALARYQPDGTLDATVGAGGIVTSPTLGIALALIVQPDGKLVAKSWSSLIRYDADGSVDSAFGSGGVTTQFHDITDVVLQPDGELMVVGDFHGGFVRGRYNAGGTPDATFGPEGFSRAQLCGGRAVFGPPRMKTFVKVTRRYGLTQEYITPYTPQQNGMIERFFLTVKQECVWLQRFESRDHAFRVVADWLDKYDADRPHSALGYLTPKEYRENIAA